MKKILFLLLPMLLLASCVGKKKYAAVSGKYEQALAAAQKASSDLRDCEGQKVSLQKEISRLQESLRGKDEALAEERKKNQDLLDQLEFMKKTNTNLLDRLSDLSVVSKAGAESIKQSLEAMNEQSKYIKDLNENIRAKDSLNLALVTNLKRSLEDINDSDVKVEVKKGVVYVSLSDKMLFKTGSAEINAQAENVIGKIARIINDHRELEVLVEGHTDNVPITTSCMVDNWDLSVKRATSVVRMLQQRHGVIPSRMTAGGKSEFSPKTGNESLDGRAMNRRTEIILTPKLDQFFKLSEPLKK